MTRRNSGDHPSRVQMVSGGRGLNTGILDSVEKQMSVLWLKDGPTSSATRRMWSARKVSGGIVTGRRNVPREAERQKKGLETQQLNPEGI